MRDFADLMLVVLLAPLFCLLILVVVACAELAEATTAMRTYRNGGMTKEDWKIYT